MKIGILTFYRGLNYGAILQAFALQSYLERIGHEVKIIRLPETKAVVASHGRSLTGWLRFIYSCARRLGVTGVETRSRRTEKFVSENLHLSDCVLEDWSEYGEYFDAVVVGSDQVWHAHNGNAPLLYLLYGEHTNRFRAISYAASFGMRSVPEEIRGVYSDGLRRFSAISVREAAGLRLLAECGAAGVHVVDPTLLVDPQLWHGLVGAAKHGTENKLVCYFLTENPNADMSLLTAFARKHGCSVHLLVDGTFPRNGIPAEIARALRMMGAGVKIRFDAGPEEFLQEIASARWVVTDSFHGSVFSYVFGVEARILRPPEGHWRGMMFDRLGEFAEDVSCGRMVKSSLADALEDISHGETVDYSHEAIDVRLKLSRSFIQKALS